MLTLLLLACTGKDPQDSRPVDDSRRADDSSPDSEDSAPDSEDSHSGDSDSAQPFEPLDGFGALSGDCGVLDVELSDSQAYFFANLLDFGAEVYDESLLSEGGKIIAEAGNLGGSSLESEIFAYEVLYRCELATLLKTEADIVYTDTGGKKTDLLLEIDGLKIGVSVTRAYHYPPSDPYTLELAQDLLNKKLGDIPLSSGNVSAEDAWVKQILSILAYTPEHGAQIQAAWEGLDQGLKGDTVLYVTVTEGEDEFIY